MIRSLKVRWSPPTFIAKSTIKLSTENTLLLDKGIKLYVYDVKNKKVSM